MSWLNFYLVSLAQRVDNVVIAVSAGHRYRPLRRTAPTATYVKTEKMSANSLVRRPDRSYSFRLFQAYRVLAASTPSSGLVPQLRYCIWQDALRRPLHLLGQLYFVQTCIGAVAVVFAPIVRSRRRESPGTGRYTHSLARNRVRSEVAGWARSLSRQCAPLWERPYFYEQLHLALRVLAINATLLRVCLQTRSNRRLNFNWQSIAGCSFFVLPLSAHRPLYPGSLTVSTRPSRRKIRHLLRYEAP